jgi:hypothetical protein
VPRRAPTVASFFPWRAAAAYWEEGAGPLGYGEDTVATTISYGSDPANKHTTAYFRRYFTVDSPTVQTRLIADLLYDDGVVVYLHGHEIARYARDW